MKFIISAFNKIKNYFFPKKDSNFDLESFLGINSLPKTLPPAQLTSQESTSNTPREDLSLKTLLSEVEKFDEIVYSRCYQEDPTYMPAYRSENEAKQRFKLAVNEDIENFKKTSNEQDKFTKKGFDIEKVSQSMPMFVDDVLNPRNREKVIDYDIDLETNSGVILNDYWEEQGDSLDYFVIVRLYKGSNTSEQIFKYRDAKDSDLDNWDQYFQSVKIMSVSDKELKISLEKNNSSVKKEISSNLIYAPDKKGLSIKSSLRTWYLNRMQGLLKTKEILEIPKQLSKAKSTIDIVNCIDIARDKQGKENPEYTLICDALQAWIAAEEYMPLLENAAKAFKMKGEKLATFSPYLYGVALDLFLKYEVSSEIASFLNKLGSQSMIDMAKAEAIQKLYRALNYFRDTCIDKENNIGIGVRQQNHEDFVCHWSIKGRKTSEIVAFRDGEIYQTELVYDHYAINKYNGHDVRDDDMYRNTRFADPNPYNELKNPIIIDINPSNFTVHFDTADCKNKKRLITFNLQEN